MRAAILALLLLWPSLAWAAFDMGFDFRNTAGFVTDAAYGVPALDDAYPHTYTNANGVSINAGWDGSVGAQDRVGTNDPRIAGIAYRPNTGTAKLFKVDLASGSAPGAGTYLVDVAIGGINDAQVVQNFKVLDDATVLIDGTNGGAGYSIASGHFIDATLTDVTASVTWTGTQVSKVFATTTAQIGTGWLVSGDNVLLNHFRLTQVTTTTSVPERAKMGVGQ